MDLERKRVMLRERCTHRHIHMFMCIQGDKIRELYKQPERMRNRQRERGRKRQRERGSGGGKIDT